jgi:hypothetical protein
MLDIELTPEKSISTDKFQIVLGEWMIIILIEKNNDYNFDRDAN